MKTRHDCKDNDYRCQYEDRHGRVKCSYSRRIVDDRPDLCPVCGEKSTYTGWTTDGRLIRSCGDAHVRPNAANLGR